MRGNRTVFCPEATTRRRAARSTVVVLLVCRVLLSCVSCAFAPSAAGGLSRRASSRLYVKGKKNRSAAQLARQLEEASRANRQSDVVIGKTSAIPGAQDFALHVERTEEEWRRSGTDADLQLKEATARGLRCLSKLQLEEAQQAFDTVTNIKPTAYLWQAGIVKFYLDDFHAARDCFRRNALLFESKFAQPATEEWIWRHACTLKIHHTTNHHASHSNNNNTHSSIHNDSNLTAHDNATDHDNNNENQTEIKNVVPFRESRKVMRFVHNLFSASVRGDLPTEALERSNLLAICDNDPTTKMSRFDYKMWKLTSWYYLGLHYDVIGNVPESKVCMNMALRHCIMSSSSSIHGHNQKDIMHILPLLHMTRRGWCDNVDDDELEKYVAKSV